MTSSKRIPAGRFLGTFAASAIFLAGCGGGACALAAPSGAAGASPWLAYMLSPSSRTVAPVSVFKTNGTVVNPNNLLHGKPTQISGQGSYITLDFGKEVGGIVTVTFKQASSASESLGLAFTESPDYVGTASDGSNAGINAGFGSSTDGAIYAAVASTGASTYTMPAKSLRGGFRYLTLFMNSPGSVKITGVSLNFTAAPTMPDPSAYPNYFYSNDTLLDQLWYAGAYTVQTNTIVPTQGRQLLSTGWDNSAVVSGGTTVLTDAAKRDRTVWSGDLGVSAATAYVSTADTLSVKNALQQWFDSQKSTGELPYGGPPFNLYGSDTYHLWGLIGTHTYYLYSGDLAWVQSVWPKYKLAMSFILAKMNGAHGLLDVTGGNDWARGDQGGENIEANAMLYRALVTGATLAAAQGDTADAQSWTATAATLRTRINQTLWDASFGAYRDNPTSTLYPQDGNSQAIWFGVADSADKTASVARYLDSIVGTLGARTPEWGGNISCFAGSMQLMALSTANRDVDALNLVRRQWGFMFNHPKGTKTFWEGFGADGGSGGYADWFMSHAHGWSSGPTSMLSFYTLGILPTGVKGQTYNVIPHPGDLTHVEGRLTFDGTKAVQNAWDRAADGSFAMTVDAKSNTGSVGTIGIPRFGLDRAVTIGGTPVWDGHAFLGAPGIASADQDASYIYFRGVQPGKRAFSSKALAAGWNTCAAEAGQCAFDGTRGVRYGSGTSFVYGSFTGGVACANASFGDPTPNVVKHCELSDTELPPSPGAWTPCAAEGQVCSFDHTKTVAYGARGAYKLLVATGSVACNSASFVGSVPDAANSCYVSNLPRNAGFETPAIATYQYGATGASWAFTAANGNNGSGLQHDGSAFGATPAPEGAQTAFLQSDASISQTLDDVAAGTYALSFQAARRAYSGGGQQSFDVSIDGQTLGTYAPTLTWFSPYTTTPIVLGAGSHTIRFTGRNLSGDNTDFIDAVSILKY